VRTLLVDAGLASPSTRLACFGAAGFSDELRRMGDEVVLVDLERLYRGA
jgi:hypothetical protein